MPQLQALIFDVDGTLAETERDGHRIAFNQAFAAAGFDWNWSIERYGELLEVAGGKERIRAYLDRHHPAFDYSGELSDLIASLHASKNNIYRQLVETGKIPLRPGVRRLLMEAREQGVQLAIATTSAPDNVLALLETTLSPEAHQWFDVIAAGDIVPAKKPAPDIYFYVLQALDLEPEHCLVIEDSHQGVKAALQAGLKTVVTVNDYTHHHDFSGATLVLNHLGEPNLPFTAIAGDPRTATFFDLALAEQLLV